MSKTLHLTSDVVLTVEAEVFLSFSLREGRKKSPLCGRALNATFLLRKEAQTQTGFPLFTLPPTPHNQTLLRVAQP